MMNPNAISPLISAHDLSEILSDEDVVVFDCRFSLTDLESGRREYDQGHIRGAHYAHLDNDLSGPIEDGSAGRHPLPDRESFASFLADHGVSNSSMVISYDNSGGAFASRLWWMMHWMGHESACVLNGGWQAWQQLDISTSPADFQKSHEGVSPPRPSFQWANNPPLETDASELLSDEVILIDSRSAERYEGKNEPIDPVAGHIPGAFNRPWMENLDDDQHFLAAENLKRRFESLGDQKKTLVFYCGSGVTACHNALATQVAGLPMPKLYAPSWSGWISDPTRAVETSK